MLYPSTESRPASDSPGTLFARGFKASRRLATFGLASALAVASTLATAPAAEAASCVSPPGSLVAWWKLDTITPSSTPELIASNYATLQGNPQIELLGQVGPAISLDGNDYLAAQDCQHIDIGTADFTIMAWVKTAPFGSPFGTIVSKRANVGGKVVGYQFQIYSGRLLFQMGDPASGHTNYWASGVPLVNDGQWHLVAVSVDRDSPTGMRISVDGGTPAVFNPTGRQGSLANNSELRMGRAVGWIDDYLDGELDEVQIYKRALAEPEILTIFNAGPSGVCAKRVPKLQLCDDGNPN